MASRPYNRANSRAALAAGDLAVWGRALDGLGGLGGVGGGALAGGLAGFLLGSKRGRNLAGTALQLGGVAAIGALAYHAYRNWQADKNPEAAAAATRHVPMLPPPSDTPFNPAAEADQQSLSRNLLRAMIAAAKADGHIDAEEQGMFLRRWTSLILTPKTRLLSWTSCASR